MSSSLPPYGRSFFFAYTFFSLSPLPVVIFLLLSVSALLSPSPLAIPFRDTLRLPKRSLLSPETRLAAPHERIIPVPLLIHQHSLYRRPWHFPCHLLFTYVVNEATYSSFLFFPYDEPDPPVFVAFPLFLVSQISPQGGENCETLPQRQANLDSLRVL